MSSYIIITERCRLREMRPDDAKDIYSLNLHPEIFKFTTDPPFSSVEEARLFIENYDAYSKTGFGRWAIELKSTNEFVGWCGLKYIQSENEVDIGYRLLPEFWGKGLATETAIACLDYGLNKIGLKRIVARVHKENIRSVSVIKKLQMDYEKDLVYDNVSWLNFEKHLDEDEFKKDKLKELPMWF